MEEEDVNAKKVKILLLIVFLLSAVCSLSLALATYTHITGELPFDLEAHYKFRDDTYGAIKKEIKAAELPIREGSIDEVTLRKLHAEMQEKEKTLNNREERLNEMDALVKGLLSNVKQMKDKTQKTLDDIKKERADKKVEHDKQLADLAAEQKNLKDEMTFVDSAIVGKIAKTLESMQPLTAMIMINDLDIKEASRLLNAMDQKKRASILSQMIEVKEVDGNKLSIQDKINFRRRANEIIKEIRMIKEEPKPEEKEDAK